jgi:hypothetical protein
MRVTALTLHLGMGWQLIVEEYGPEIVYLPGVHNIVADFLSRHPISTYDSSKHVRLALSTFQMTMQELWTLTNQTST